VDADLAELGYGELRQQQRRLVALVQRRPSEAAAAVQLNE
jgi:hypothetical protein